MTNTTTGQRLIELQWRDDVLALLQQVAEHWKDTDAPIGEEARRLLEQAPSA